MNDIRRPNALVDPAAMPRVSGGSSAADPESPPALVTKGLSAWYGSALAIQDVQLAIPRNQHHRPHRPFRLRQEHPPALLQPDE